MSEFATRLIAWQQEHGRHDLPWQNTRDPYRIWVSEIMLQQTQVTTVIPYYQRFTARFPDIASLADAHEDDVLAHWSGLGYYSRARNLHRAAQEIATRHAGVFPRQLEDIVALPGIGRSTAAAIAAFAFGQRHAILDGNVKRVVARYGAIDGYPGDKAVEQRMWRLAEQLLPDAGPDAEIEAYTQGIMDLGATTCTRAKPRCDACPVGAGCAAHAQGRVDDLPSPRPRKALPEREITMLILLRGRDVLLEKRPPSGIWGGLWSLPEAGVDVDPTAVARARYGVYAHKARALPDLVHTFTHFRLNIRPRLLTAIDRSDAVREPGFMWISLDDALGAALPAPIRKLLGQIQP
jgi:A/G-specific adenine glycosylase